MPDTIGIAVIGAGMAGKAHAAAYRNAPTLFDPILPRLRYVSIGDVNEQLGAATAKRFGFERADSSWQAIVDAPDIDVVSVVVANRLHREIVEALLAAGKHVLCEKPLSDSLSDARLMAVAAAQASGIARVGFTYRRTPGIAAVRELIQNGTLGRVLHFSGHYWTDYAADPMAPMSWRYQGGPGSGALADVGSHLAYVAEFLAGSIRSVNGGRLSTEIARRPLPIGVVTGHDHAEVSDVFEQVENDDYAGFSAEFDQGVGQLEVSRVAAGHPNSLGFEVFCENGSATFDQHRPAEIGLFLMGESAVTNGYRQVILGPGHPYLSNGLPMDAPGVGFGYNETFAYQARAFLEEVAGVDGGLPPNATFDDGVHNMEILDAAVQSAAAGGSRVDVTQKEMVR